MSSLKIGELTIDLNMYASCIYLNVGGGAELVYFCKELSGELFILFI